jgi:hypothetical protein
MSVDNKNRTGRPILILGQFINCRHHSSAGSDNKSFRCAKHMRALKTCDACFTCPKCGSPLYDYHVHEHRGKSCAICGAYIEYQGGQPPKQRADEGKGEHVCQVQGCKHTAYEKHQYLEEIDGRTISFLICETHRRRVKTWKQAAGKDETQRPIIFRDYQLQDNPKYRKARVSQRTEKDPETLRIEREKFAEYARDHRKKKKLEKENS